MPRSEASRQKILAAAIAVAAERGYEGTTISRVTQRSGLPASSVYWHFGDKDGLLAAVVDESFRTWRERHQAWVDDDTTGDLGAALHRMLLQRLQGMAGGNAFYCIGMMLTLEARDSPSSARARFLEIRSAIVAGMQEWFEGRVEASLQQRHPELVAELVDLTLSFVQGVFLAQRRGSGPSATHYLEPMVQIILARLEAARAQAS